MTVLVSLVMDIKYPVRMQPKSTYGTFLLIFNDANYTYSYCYLVPTTVIHAHQTLTQPAILSKSMFAIVEVDSRTELLTQQALPPQLLSWACLSQPLRF